MAPQFEFQMKIATLLSIQFVWASRLKYAYIPILFYGHREWTCPHSLAPFHLCGTKCNCRTVACNIYFFCEWEQFEWMAVQKGPQIKATAIKMSDKHVCLVLNIHTDSIDWSPRNVFNVTLFMFLFAQKCQDSLRFRASYRQIMFSCPNSLLFRNRNWIALKCVPFLFWCFDLNCCWH